jgi:hypothetical protein
MKLKQTYNIQITRYLILFILFITPGFVQAQQRISFGIHADPVISWFGSDIKETKYNKYFTPNYSFSTGISLLNAGGRLVSSDTTIMEFTNFNSTVLPGKPVIYKIQYLAVPIGLKLQTNQIGYITFFSDLGIDPKVVVGGKADIPSLNVSGEKAISELRVFNMSYHVTAGIEYSLGGTTAMVLGLNFENNFLDITKDNKPQLKDKVSHKLLGFRIGLNF